MVLSLICGTYLTRDIAQHMQLDLLSFLFGIIIFATTTIISFVTLAIITFVAIFLYVILF